MCVGGGGGGGGGRGRGGLVPSRLANIFGNGTIHKHGKKYKRAKIPEINRINRAPKPRASFEVPKASEPEAIVRRTLRKSRVGEHSSDHYFSNG